jgi:hypothetical protein
VTPFAAGGGGLAAQLIALVKPTFELHAVALANQLRQVTTAARAIEAHGWQIRAY